MEIKKLKINQTVYLLTVIRQPDTSWSVSISVEGQQVHQALTCAVVSWTPEQNQLVLKVNNHIFTVEVAQIFQTGGCLLTLAGCARQVHVEPVTVAAPADRTLTAGSVFTPAHREHGASILTDPGAFISPLAGRVTKVLVVQGQAVSKNQPLVVIESMKMENELCAPYDAVIKTQYVFEGDVIKTNQVLLSLERKKGEGDATTEDGNE